MPDQIRRRIALLEGAACNDCFDEMVAALEMEFPDGLVNGHNFSKKACQPLVAKWLGPDIRDDD